MPEDASVDFGAYLRLAREQKGRSLREMAVSTKISVMSLEALERNDASRLPGGIFSRAFVRSYAKEVGLDPEEAVRRFVARFPEASMEESPRPYDPNPDKVPLGDPIVSGHMWRRVAYCLPLVLVVAYFAWGGRLGFWSTQAPVDTLTATPVAGTAASTVAAGESKRADVPLPATDVATAPVPPVDAANATTPGSDTAVSASSPAVVPASEPSSAASAPGAFRVLLAPRENCWVSVRVNGASVFSGLMQAGEKKELELSGEVSLTVGNAGAFAYSINGRPARSLGAGGEVVTARLNAGNLQTFFESR